MNEEPLEVVETSSRSIEAIERAEIDIQIATARRFPRSVNTKAISETISLHATISEETARECYYAIPRAGIVINGPSVRLSEIVANCYGNLHIAGRIIDHDLVNRSVTAQAVAWDLQSNVRRTAEWSEPITQRASDAAKMTKLVAISKAERNAIFKVVPRVIWERVLQKCIEAAIGDAASLQTRLGRAVKAFSPFGVVPEQILHTFGVDSIEKLNQTDLATLLGMHTALKEGTATIDDLFKPTPKKQNETATDRPVTGTSEAGARAPELRSSEAPADPITHDALDIAKTAVEPPPRRKGRPIGSKNKPKDESPNPPDTKMEGKIEPPDEGASGKAEARLAEPDPVVDSGNDPKSAVIAKIRAKLEDKHIQESRLLAILHQWKWSENPAQPLEDFNINNLELVDKRFEQVVNYK